MNTSNIIIALEIMAKGMAGILCRSPFVQFSQLQKPKFVKVLLYTNEKDKITTKGKKMQQKPCKGRQTYLLHSLCIFDRLLLTG